MLIAPQEVEKTTEGRALKKIHSSFSSALRSLHPNLDWNPSSLNERKIHLRLLENIKHKLEIKKVIYTAFFAYSHHLLLRIQIGIPSAKESS